MRGPHNLFQNLSPNTINNNRQSLTKFDQNLNVSSIQWNNLNMMLACLDLWMHYRTMILTLHALQVYQRSIKGEYFKAYKSFSSQKHYIARLSVAVVSFPVEVH